MWGSEESNRVGAERDFASRGRRERHQLFLGYRAPTSARLATAERRVRNDCAVEVDGNAYSVPRRLIGERIEAGQVRMRHGVRELAVYARLEEHRYQVIDAVGPEL